MLLLFVYFFDKLIVYMSVLILSVLNLSVTQNLSVSPQNVL